MWWTIQEILQDIMDFYFVYYKIGFKIAISTFLISFFILRHYKTGSERKNYQFGNLKNSFVLSILSFYIYVVIGITLLSRREAELGKVNLKLFSVFNKDYPMRIWIYENIFMFVPYAILLYVLASSFRKFKVSLVVGVLSSFIIELTQGVTHRGIFELDDILMNTIGMAFGFCFCILVQGICILVYKVEQFFWKKYIKDN